MAPRRERDTSSRESAFWALQLAALASAKRNSLETRIMISAGIAHERGGPAGSRVDNCVRKRPLSPVCLRYPVDLHQEPRRRPTAIYRRHPLKVMYIMALGMYGLMFRQRPIAAEGATAIEAGRMRAGMSRLPAGGIWKLLVRSPCPGPEWAAEWHAKEDTRQAEQPWIPMGCQWSTGWDTRDDK